MEKVVLHKLTAHEDNRGYFKELYNIKSQINILGYKNWVTDAVSFTEHKNTIRGMHMQGNSMAKLVTVLSGKIFDVVVDLRKDSPGYLEWQGFYLSGDNHKQLYIPAGFAHGFLTLTDNVLFHYKLSELHDPASEESWRYDSEKFGVEWPIMSGGVILSKRDRGAREYAE